MRMNLRSDSPKSQSKPHRALLLTAFAAFVLLVLAGFVVWTFADNVNPALTDARADWIVVSAAYEGMDPWSDLPTLGSDLGTEYLPVGAEELGDFERVHPRTPAALLLLSPLILVGADTSYVAALIAGTLFFLATALIVRTRFNWFSPTLLALYAIVCMTTAAFLQSSEFGAQSTLILLLIGVAWQSNRGKDSVSGGLALGVAICLKIFPGLLLIPLLGYRRYRAAFTAVFVFVGLNAFSLEYFGLDPLDALTAIRSASESWVGFSGNGSLAMPLVSLGMDPTVAGYLAATVAVVVSVVVVMASRSWGEAVSTVLVIALLGSPLVWVHYGVVGFLVAGFLISEAPGLSSGKRVRFWVGLWFSLQILMIPINSIIRSGTWTSLGSISLAANLALLAACLIRLRENRVLPLGNSRLPVEMDSIH